MSAKPTPVPWNHEGQYIFVAGRGIIAICPTPQKTGVFECSRNVEFIVRAVNNFDALVEACKAVEAWQADKPLAYVYFEKVLRPMLRETIKLAEEETP